MYYNFKNLLLKYDYQNSGSTVFHNLYRSLRSVIEAKEIPDNFKLPPSRVLADDLNLSRSTVLKAYDLLLMEKVIVSKQGSGYYTHKLENTGPQEKNGEPEEWIPKKNPKISKLGKSFLQHFEYGVGENYMGEVCFRPGLPPLDIFPVAVWQKLSMQYWKSIKYSELSYYDTLGIEILRESIANYLKIYRNVECDPDQIVVTTGSLHSLSLVSMALLDPKDAVILESPTYKKAHSLFAGLKAKIYTADLNDDDSSLSSLEDIDAKLMYVTPSSQYPSGKRMSLERREKLLEFASKKNLLIIEDDYDHEFSNWENSISSMFSLDHNSSVVYLGTFNKLLHPSLRLGYMIIPKFLISTITGLSKGTFRFVSPSLQHIMALFISNDHLNKHLRMVIKRSNERREVFIEHFQALFKDKIQLEINCSGLHLIGILDDGIKDYEFCNYLMENNIVTYPLSSYYINDQDRNGLVMGFCSVNKTTIKKKLDKMHQLYLNYESARQIALEVQA